MAQAFQIASHGLLTEIYVHYWALIKAATAAGPTPVATPTAVKRLVKQQAVLKLLDEHLRWKAAPKAVVVKQPTPEATPEPERHGWFSRAVIALVADSPAKIAAAETARKAREQQAAAQELATLELGGSLLLWRAAEKALEFCCLSESTSRKLDALIAAETRDAEVNCLLPGAGLRLRRRMQTSRERATEIIAGQACGDDPIKALKQPGFSYEVRQLAQRWLAEILLAQSSPQG